MGEKYLIFMVLMCCILLYKVPIYLLSLSPNAFSLKFMVFVSSQRILATTNYVGLKATTINLSFMLFVSFFDDIGLREMVTPALAMTVVNVSVGCRYRAFVLRRRLHLFDRLWMVDGWWWTIVD